MSQQTQATSNVLDVNAMKKVAFECGSDRGKGNDAQIRFALQVVASAYQGGIDLDRNKHGTDRDDAQVLCDEYFKGRVQSGIFDHKADKAGKFVSCIRTLTKLGGYTKGGQGEPISTVNDLMTERQKAKAQPTSGKKLDDAFNTVMRFARAQIRRDQMIDKAEFPSFIFKKGKEPADLEESWDALRKAAQKIKTGKNGMAADPCPEITVVIDACTKRLKQMATQKAAHKPGGVKAK